MLGDIQLSEPGAMIGFAGARVIEQTVREKLPEGFQRAEYLRDHGLVDLVVARKEMKDVLARLIGMLVEPRGIAGAEVVALAQPDLAIPPPPAGATIEAEAEGTRPVKPAE